MKGHALFPLLLVTLFSPARAAEGDGRLQAVNLQFQADAKELLAEHEVAVIALFGPDQKSQRALYRRVSESAEFAGVGVVLADSTEPRVLEHFEVDPADTPVVRMYRNFGPDGEEDAERHVVDFAEGVFQYSPLKSWVFRESLPPVLHLGDNMNGEQRRNDELVARTFAAFRQVTFSKFMVLHEGDLMDEVEDALYEFAHAHYDELLVITVDMATSVGQELGSNTLRMGGLPRSAVRPGMERPPAVMLGETGALEFDGLYEMEPMEWFFSDWKEQGAGGCNGTWWEPPRKRKKKKTKKAANKDL